MRIQNLTFWLLGLFMAIFGLNKLIGFIPVQPPENAIAQQFLMTMFDSYLFVIVAAGEIVGGLLLFFPKTRFLGWLLLAPIIFNIVAFHLAHDFVGNGIWLLPAMLFLTGFYFFKSEKFTFLNG